jgi:hypothetical protein
LDSLFGHTLKTRIQPQILSDFNHSHRPCSALVRPTALGRTSCNQQTQWCSSLQRFRALALSDLYCLPEHTSKHCQGSICQKERVVSYIYVNRWCCLLLNSTTHPSEIYRVLLVCANLQNAAHGLENRRCGMQTRHGLPLSVSYWLDSNFESDPPVVGFAPGRQRHRGTNLLPNVRALTKRS